MWLQFFGFAIAMIAGQQIVRHAQDGTRLIAFLLVLAIGVGGVMYGAAK